MMLNLFSMFNPYMGYFIFNWFFTMICFFIIPQIYWLFSSRLLNFFIFTFNNLWNEFKVVVFLKFNLMNLLLFITSFVYILMNNFMGSFPYLFTSSSHLVFSMCFSLSMWLGLMIFGWLKNSTHMFIHSVSMETPLFLMFFMVSIETLSNIIRPFTLCIRLVANMIADHLLLTLLSSFIRDIFVLYLIVLLVQILLLILETAVLLILSYVSVILMILNLKETN